MKCPKCGADGAGTVKDSRVKEDHVYRIRECYRCGCRYRTSERIEGLATKEYAHERGKKNGDRSKLMLDVWKRMREGV